MKAEHRKELHTNLLADRLNKLVTDVKAGPSSRSLLTWIGVGLIVVIFFAWRFYSNRTLHSRSEQWASMDAALHDPDGATAKLNDLATNHRRTLPGRIARFHLARRNLQDGVRGLPAESSRDKAVEKLKEAREEFTQLAGECVDDPILGAEALMGRARAVEALAGVPDPGDEKKGLGDLDQALEAYRQVVKKYPDSAETKIAQERIKAYEDTQNPWNPRAFYEVMRRDYAVKPAPPITPPPGN